MKLKTGSYKIEYAVKMVYIYRIYLYENGV